MPRKKVAVDQNIFPELTKLQRQLSTISSQVDRTFEPLKALEAPINSFTEAAKTIEEHLKIPKINMAEVALSASFTVKSSEEALSYATSPDIRERTPPEKIEKVDKSIQALNELSKAGTKVKEMAEETLTEDDVAEKTADLFAVINDSKIISKQLQVIGREMAKGTDKNRIKSSIILVYEKLDSSVKRLFGSAKSVGIDLLNSVKEFMKGSGKKFLRDSFNKIANGFNRFLTAVIGAIFGFAGWVQKIAEKKKFTMKEITIEMPFLDYTSFSIGPLIIPIPDIKAPKLIAKFVPIKQV